MRGGESSVVGLISQENDDRLSDVKADLKTRKEQRAFDTIRGYAAVAEAMRARRNAHAPSQLTYRDADTVLNDGACRQLAGRQARRREVADVRPGFLTSLTELIAAKPREERLQSANSLHTRRSSLPAAPASNRPPLRDSSATGALGRTSFEGRFETGEAGTRSGTRFELVYGASGPLAGIPILISYQPKWWLQVDLVLNS